MSTWRTSWSQRIPGTAAAGSNDFKQRSSGSPPNVLGVYDFFKGLIKENAIMMFLT